MLLVKFLCLLVVEIIRDQQIECGLLRGHDVGPRLRLLPTDRRRGLALTELDRVEYACQAKILVHRNHMVIEHGSGGIAVDSIVIAACSREHTQRHEHDDQEPRLASRY